MPIAAVQELARNWGPCGLYATTPEIFYGHPDWQQDGGTPCIPARADGIDHIKQIVRETPPDATTAAVFAVDLPGGMIRSLTAALNHAGCQADVVLLSMCRSRDAWHGRADALIIDATKQWGNNVVHGATRL